MVHDETWNGDIYIFADQKVFLDRLAAFGGCPVQVRQATDAIFRQTRVMSKQLGTRGTAFPGLEGHVGLGNVFECLVVDDLARVVTSNGIQEPA